MVPARIAGLGVHNVHELGLPAAGRRSAVAGKRRLRLVVIVGCGFLRGSLGVGV